MTYNELINELLCLSYPKGEERARKICATNCKLICIKSKDLCLLAKRLLSEREEIIYNYPDNDYYEVDILKAYLVTQNKTTLDDRIRFFRRLAPHIENWAVCDSLGKRFKLSPSDEAKLWAYVDELLSTEKVFMQRLGLDLIMSELLKEEYLDRIFDILNELTYGQYYMDMGAAWLLAEMYAKFHNRTVAFFKSDNKLSKFVQNKALQKARESFRVTAQQKELANLLKRK